MVCSDAFGPLVAGEAQRRGFYQAARRAFLGDGQAWNWTIHANQPAGNEEKLPDHDPRTIVQRALTYRENNKARMDYPAYRREGLPVSTAMVESLIKEINHRVKGTEKFWNRPEGAERILQVRAAALGDDNRLSQWILNRPGSCSYRPTTQKQQSPATAA